MPAKELVRLAVPLVPLALLLPGLGLDLLLLLLVAAHGRLVLGRRLLSHREPGGPGRLLHGGLDPLRLVVGPLVRGLGLELRRLALEDQGLVDGRAGPQRRDRSQSGQDRGRERDLLQETAASFMLERLMDGLLELVGVDLRLFRHRGLPPRWPARSCSAGLRDRGQRLDDDSRAASAAPRAPAMSRSGTSAKRATRACSSRSTVLSRTRERNHSRNSAVVSTTPPPTK